MICTLCGCYFTSVCGVAPEKEDPCSDCFMLELLDELSEEILINDRI